MPLTEKLYKSQLLYSYKNIVIGYIKIHYIRMNLKINVRYTKSSLFAMFVITVRI